VLLVPNLLLQRLLSTGPEHQQRGEKATRQACAHPSSRGLRAFFCQIKLSFTRLLSSSTVAVRRKEFANQSPRSPANLFAHGTKTPEQRVDSWNPYALDAPVRNVHAGRRGRSGEGTGRACRRSSLVNVAIAMHRLGIATRSPIDFIG
jgi:hypothetical protein